MTGPSDTSDPDIAPKERRIDRRRLRYLKVLGRYLLPYRGRLVLALVALVIAASSVLAFGSGLRWLVDEGFKKGGEGPLDTALIGLFVVVVILAGATAARAYLVAWLGERVAADMRRDVFANVLRLDPAFYEVTPTGEVLSRLTTDTTLLQTIIGSSASMALRNFLMMIGGVVMMAITSPKLTALALLIVPAAVLPIVFFGRKVRRLSRASQDRLGDVGAHIDETLNAASTIQAFNREPMTRARFMEEVEAAFTAAARRSRARSAMAGSVILLVFAAIGLILWNGGHDLVDGRITAGQLSAFVFYAALVAGAVGALSEFTADMQRALGASERLVELLNAEPKIAPPATPTPLPSPPRGAVAFDDVRFFYPARPDAPALDAFSLTIAPGERVALVGPSGAGKTTVFQLLLRFHDPETGAIKVDGVDLRSADPADVRGRIGLVPQEPVIFTGSVAQNIAFGRPDATRQEIEDAAHTAAAGEFIAALPDGFDTHLGEKGVRLSGGQRQRIAIARAILRDPAILLLDEATSSLDAESEQQVQRAIERIMSERTTLVIAHRLATVLKADRIVVLEEGRIVAQGTHAELVRTNPLYARLAELQFNDAAA